MFFGHCSIVQSLCSTIELAWLEVRLRYNPQIGGFEKALAVDLLHLPASWQGSGGGGQRVSR